MLLQVINGTKDFAGEVLFEDIQFEIKEGHKIAVIGRNGCGKTTLLKIISGLLALDKGKMVKANNISIGYLSQQAFENDDLTVQEEFDKVFAEVFDLEKQMTELSEKLKTQYDDSLLKQYSQLQNRYEALDGYNYNQEQLTLFTKFGFSIQDLQRRLSTFSGGQRTRIAFVKLLLQKPDILLLDEPTNHLDMDTIVWLESYLQKYSNAIVVVSHDRMFLDKIVNEVYEFEFGELNHYVGNYSSYVQQKQLAFQQQKATYQRQQAEIARLSALIEKFRYKKNKAAFAQSKIKYLERMEKVDKPQEDRGNFKLRFDPKLRGGKNVLTVEHLVIGYDKPLCTINFNLNNGQRLAVIGPNGLGKSTFVKTLMGQVKALAGDYLFGHQIEVGYFDQQLAEITSNKTVLDEIWDMFPEYNHTEIRKILGQFMFSADDVYKTSNVLSGGEKVRLFLAKLMLEKPNLLILDEPTNHLDIMGKEALEQALLEYNGTVLFVSHDRYFIQKLATCILRIENDKTEFYSLNYDEYMEKLSGKTVDIKVESEEKNISSSKQQRDNSKKAANLEKRISKAEEELELLRELRFNPEYYHDFKKMQELDEKIDEKHNEIAHLMEEWEVYAQ